MIGTSTASTSATKPLDSEADGAPTSRVPLALARVASRERGYWGTIDQAISSATNIIPALLLARALGVREFSTFAAVSATAALATGLARALVGEPLLVRAATVRAGDRRLVHSARWSAVGLGLVVAVACTLASRVVAGEPLERALLAFAIVAVGILVQDVSRYLLFSSLRHRAACLNDVAWLALTMIGFVAWAAGGQPLSVASGIMIWGIAGSVAAVVATVQLGDLRWESPTHCLRNNGRLGKHFAIQFFALAGAAQIALYILGVVADLEAIGAVRATQLLFGPITITFVGAYVTLLPKGLGDDVRAYRPAMIRASVLLSVAASACCLAILAVPSAVGELFLGETWQSARPLIVPYGLYLVAVSAATGPWVGLAALERMRTLSLLRICSVPLTLAASITGGAMWGEIGFVYGLGASSMPIVIAGWIAFNRSLCSAQSGPQLASMH